MCRVRTLALPFACSTRAPCGSMCSGVRFTRCEGPGVTIMRCRLAARFGMVLAVLLASVLGWTAERPKPAGATSAPAKPKAKITISKGTTRITEPLTPDGYPDYLEWLNRKYSKGVTPDNNAVVLLWRIVGPREVPETN